MTFVPPELPSRPFTLGAEHRTLRTTRRSLRIFSLLFSLLMVIAIALR